MAGLNFAINKRRRADRGSDDEDETHPPDVDPEARRFVVADAQNVEQTAMQQNHRRAGDDIRPGQDAVVPAGRREPAEQPGVDLSQRLLPLLLHERLRRRHEGGDRHPGQNQRRGRAHAADGTTQHVRTSDACRRSEEGGERNELARTAGIVDRERRAETGAGCDAEQVRVGERVPKDALVRRAGDGEHPADERSEHDTRRPQLPEDRFLRSAER